MWKLTKENLKLPEVKGRTGIYRFWCYNHSYIGSAKDLKKRLTVHINTMKHQRHHNHTVQDEESIERNRKALKEYYKIHLPQNSKTVYQYTISGEFIKEYSNAAFAARENKISHSVICSCCNGKAKTAGNYRWSYEKKTKLGPIQKKYKSKPIYQFDKDWNFICVWYSFADITNQLHLTAPTIKKYLNKNILYRYCYWTTNKPESLNSIYTINPVLNQPKFLPNERSSKSLSIWFSWELHKGIFICIWSGSSYGSYFKRSCL